MRAGTQASCPDALAANRCPWRRGALHPILDKLNEKCRKDLMRSKLSVALVALVALAAIAAGCGGTSSGSSGSSLSPVANSTPKEADDGRIPAFAPPTH